jgi:hypothetical protein
MPFNPNSVKPFNDTTASKTHWSEVEISYAAGTDTTSFDRFRQGVELTMPRYYYEGTVKIHSGEEEHEIKQCTFGQSKIRISPYPRFEEVDNWNPVTYVQWDHYISQETLLRTYNNTFPVVVGDIDRYEFLNGDGALEPLALREKSNNYSIDIPFFAHDIKAAFLEGNVNYLLSHDLIVNKYTPEDEISAINYFDSVDTAQGGGIIEGYVSPEIAFNGPVRDNKQSTGIKLSVNMSNQMVDALRLMSPPDDAYASSDQIVMTSGFVHDFSRFGTDSIAFGGMSASQIQISEEIDV